MKIEEGYESEPKDELLELIYSEGYKDGFQAAIEMVNELQKVRASK